MKKYNIIALDMDGVVNSSVQIRKWYNNKFDQLQHNGNAYINDELRLQARRQFNQEFDHSTQLIFPFHAKYIKQICQKTDSYILWSSSWRLLPKYKNIENAKNMFNKHGLPGDRLIGYTQQSHMYDGGCRGSVIKNWLKNNQIFKYSELHKCAIIDDRPDAGQNILPAKMKLFWIDPQQGITQYETKYIIEYLNQ